MQISIWKLVYGWGSEMSTEHKVGQSRLEQMSRLFKYIIHTHAEFLHLLPAFEMRPPEVRRDV